MRTPHNERLAPTIERSETGPSKGPERRCILTGRHGERAMLLRLAISPPDGDGKSDVLPDVRARAPGRGAWLSVSRVELEEAMAKGKLKGALARAFKSAPPRVPDDLPEKIEAGLLRDLTDRLGLEMRSGQLILGSDRIGEHARGGALHALYHAADASAGGASKLDQAWRVGMDREGSGEGGTRLPLDRGALSVALGRENVVHFGLADAKAAQRVDVALKRLLHFQGALADASAGVSLSTADHPAR